MPGPARHSEGGEAVLGLVGIVALVSSVAAVTTWFAAVETSVGSDPFTWLINLGVAGIVIVLLVTGQLRTKAEVEHLLKENAKKDEVIDAVQQTLLEQTLPALAKSTQVIEQVPASERALIDALKEQQEKTAEMLARMEALNKESNNRGGGRR